MASNAPKFSLAPEVTTQDVAAALRLARPFVQALADALAVALAQAQRGGEIDQRSPELARFDLSSRTFLEAARAAAFPTVKRGRRVVAKVADLEAWRSGARDAAQNARTSAARAPVSSDDDLRAELGLVARPKLRAVGGRSR